MNRKLLLMTMVVVALSFMTSGAMAQVLHSFPAADLARHKTNRIGPFETLAPDLASSGNTAGTILTGGGLGDALIFPYYDVRNITVVAEQPPQEQDFYFAIINETIDPSTIVNSETIPIGGVAAKIRFREFDKSIEVYDLDIWLSCNDVWVGTVTNNNGVAHIVGSDLVIVDSTDDDFIVDQAISGGKDFLPSRQKLSNDRSLLGYFEVIGEEMTVCKTYTPAGTTSTHVERLFPTSYRDAPNTLAGYAYIIRPFDGVAMGYNATSIANFSVHSKTGNTYLANRSGTGFSLFVGAGQEAPDLMDCEDTLDQLEFLLSKFQISGGFSIEPGPLGRTSFVVTFPTKHFHFNGPPTFSIHANTGTYGVGDLSGSVWGAPFFGTPDKNTMNTGEPVTVRAWNRDEAEFSIPGGFESPPVTAAGNALPFEVNIIGWYTGSSAPTLVGRDNVGFPVGDGVINGWTLLQFEKEGRNLETAPIPGNVKLDAFDWYGNLFDAYVGLPAVGIIVQQFNNLNLATGGAYGEMLPLFYKNNWEKPEGMSTDGLSPLPCFGPNCDGFE